MSYCNQCGTELSIEAKFCQRCGVALNNEGNHKTLDANLRVSIKNETTEKILKDMSQGAEHIKQGSKELIYSLKDKAISEKSLDFYKGIADLIKTLLFIAIIVFIISLVIALALEFYEDKQRVESMTFDPEKVLGHFDIYGMAVNDRYIRYKETRSIENPNRIFYNVEYYDDWPYSNPDKDKDPRGLIYISYGVFTITTDLNRDNDLSNDKEIYFKTTTISRLPEKNKYSYGVIKTESGDVLVELIASWGENKKYSFSFMIGNNKYTYWAAKQIR